MSRRRRRPGGPRSRAHAARPLPPFPAEPPPHVVAFVDQLDAAVRAGELPEGQAWHLDVSAPPGALVLEVAPRLCTAPAGADCDGGCSS